jgi:hypothetical protein
MAGVNADTAEVAQQLGDARERERAVGDILRAIARAEGLSPVFKTVVDAANRMCDGAYSALYLGEGEVLRASVSAAARRSSSSTNDRIHIRMTDERSSVALPSHGTPFTFQTCWLIPNIRGRASDSAVTGRSSVCRSSSTTC